MTTVIEYGLTKREWFAGMALQGMIREMNTDDMTVNLRQRPGPWIAEAVAYHAVLAADALIAELDKEPCRDGHSQTDKG